MYTISTPRTSPSYQSSSPIPILPSSLFMRHQIRTKTYRKKQSRPMQRVLKRMAKDVEFAALKRKPKVYQPVHENKFWKVVGDMKIYKFNTPGTSNRRHPVRFHLHRGSAIKRLSFGKRSTGGRNNHGRVTVRHRGGGHKKRVRMIDFIRSTPGPHEVVRLEYDPNRSADLALLRGLATNEFSYIIRPDGVQPGAIVESWRSGIPFLQPGEEPISKAQMIRDGNCLMLKDIPVGSTIHCISLTKDGPAKICRSAGTSAQLLQITPDGLAHIRLVSKEVRTVPADAVATIGVVCNANHNQRLWGKAGSRRHKGWRPSVRGIAQSAYNHPTGGGQKSKGNRPPSTPWGQLTKGWKTVRGWKAKQSHIIVPKWKAKVGAQ